VLKPYFWPKGVCSKLQCAATFLVMAGSKTCNLLAPLEIGAAAQRLSDGELPVAELARYCAFRFGSTTLAEVQRLVYIKVKQTAFAELAETTFRHLLGLSLDWHLRKKMGEVLRVLDRGIGSADSVMNYLVLFLGPSLIECAVTLVLFASKFKSVALSLVIFTSFAIYVVLTVSITKWRKKFREGQNKQDNKYHDLATDSLINFETVKYFANEDFEVGQFKAAVKQYQSFNVMTQASLSLINTSQQLDIQTTALIALCLASSSVLAQSSPGEPVQIGQFVAVNAYIMQLFQPLSFLGTIYSTVIQAFIDMRNLTELLLISPDVRDAPNAKGLRLTDPRRGAHVEFREVDFAYPTQQSKGLRGVSFQVSAGSTAALVGPTGAGKSTISRLLFRFYDVRSGSILLDGQDITAVTQHSLRSAIGVVPQDTVLFNSSIKANIEYGKSGSSQADLVDAARRAQILSLIDGLELGWDTVVGERGLRVRRPPLLLVAAGTWAHSIRRG
jgi:ABC-type transport system involved in Fe-S cluster assembly fused permease/ATPase subunit